MNIIKLETCASTNSYLKELADKESLTEGTVASTVEQTSGRGQAGNSWEAAPGKNLTFSMLLYPSFLPVKDYFLLSEAVALGIKDVLDIYVDQLSVKWPNDIYYQDQKLVGILFENEIGGSQIDRSVMGIGINVNQETFISDAPNPVSLKQITGIDFDLESLLEQTVESILRRYGNLKEGLADEITRDYHHALYRKDGFHLYRDKEGIFSASIERIDNSGFLHLVTSEGELRQYAFKEVSILHQ